MMALSLESQPSHTLVLVTPTQSARIDFIGSRQPRLKQVWVQTSVESDKFSSPTFEPKSLTAAVAQALDLGPQRLGKVSILSTHFWTDILQLADDVVAIATPQEIRQALSIEAEAESGLAAFDSQVVCQRMDGTDGRSVPFCTTQIANSQVSQLKELVQSRRSSLYRLAHPIVLNIEENLSQTPPPLDAIIEGLQAWNVAGLGGNQPAGQQSHHRNLEEIANRFGRLLGHRGSNPQFWLKPVPAWSHRQVIALSSILSVATTLGCIAWNYQSRWQLLSVSNSVEQLELQRTQHNETSADIKRHETRLVQLRKAVQVAEDSLRSTERQVRLAMAQHRRSNTRWGCLLDALSETAGDCWIRRIESSPRATTIHGISPSSSGVHAFAARLEDRLLGVGWSLAPAATEQLSAGLYEFSLGLTPDSSIPESSDTIAKNLPDAASDKLVNWTFAASREGLP